MDSINCSQSCFPFFSALPDTSSFNTWTRVAGVVDSDSDDHDYAAFHSAGVRGDDQTALEENDDGDRFAVRAGRFIYGCGAFFALKIQSAKSPKQMEEFEKEVVNLEKLRGHSNIVQIRDHTLLPRTGHVVILMELAACDLDTFFKRSGYSFDVSGMLSIWRALVDAVGVAHTEDIIHRDLKPQNFLLVPIAPPFADRILATTPVSSENFEFRIVNRATAEDSEKVGDVELILKDSATAAPQVLQLIIKVSDFGLAQPLDLGENAPQSHLSVEGHAGTVKYMAPEAFQASEDGLQRLTKHVDIWALGVMLFQMLHGGRTPFDAYCWPGKPIRAAVAIASRDIHAKVMIFDRQGVWATERKSLQRNDPHALGRTGSEGDIVANVCQSSTAMSLLSTEFLFRVCENCLAFEASDRGLAGDLKMWVGHLLDSKWWEETIRSLPDAAVQDLLSGVSMEDDEVETASQLDTLNLVQQGGDRIEQVFFRELRRAVSPPRHANASTNIVSLPATGEGVEEREQRDNGEQLQAVVLPAGGEAVEERGQTDDGAQLGAVPLPGTEEAVEKEGQGDDGEHSQVCLLSARWESVEKCEAEEGDRGPPLQVVGLPTRGARGEREEGEDKEQLQAAQELLPRCIDEEDCGRLGAECASELPTRLRPRRRRFVAPQCSCDFNIMGIIGVTFTVLAMAVGLFVVFKLIPEAAPEPSVSIPPTAPTFLAPTIPLPSPTVTAPVLVDPKIAPPASTVAVVAPTIPPASPSPAPTHTSRPRPGVSVAAPTPSPSSGSSLRVSTLTPPDSPSSASPSPAAPLGSSNASFSNVAAPQEGVPTTEQDQNADGVFIALCRASLEKFVGMSLEEKRDRGVWGCQRQLWGAAAVGENASLKRSPLSSLRDAPRCSVVLAAVELADGQAATSETFQNDREVVLAAVGQDGLILKYAPADLRKNKDVVLAAVQNDGSALMWAVELWGDEELPPEDENAYNEKMWKAFLQMRKVFPVLHFDFIFSRPIMGLQKKNLSVFLAKEKRWVEHWRDPIKNAEEFDYM